MIARKRVYAISKEVLRMINQAAQETFPNEFVAAMRAEEGIIVELLLLPGTLQGEDSAILQLHMLPVDYTVVGTVHSHPGPSNRPSGADRALFSRFGYVHIITCLPYNENSWRAYDLDGRPFELKVVDEPL
jgi:proteasome lid subunit RPN8/RPN11